MRQREYMLKANPTSPMDWDVGYYDGPIWKPVRTNINGADNAKMIAFALGIDETKIAKALETAK